MRPALVRLPSVLCALVAMSGCGIDAYEPSICKTAKDKPFVADPININQTRVQDFDFNFGEEIRMFENKNIKTDVRLVSLTLIAKGGQANWDFIDEGHGTILPPSSSSLQPVEILTYRKVDGAKPTDTLKFTGNTGVDILKYLDSGHLKFQTVLTGSIPASFNTDAKPCISITAKIL